MRLQLRPSLRRAWRGPHTVQIGVSPTRGTVLDGLDGHDTALLDRLRDGLDPRFLRSLPAHTPRTDGLLRLLSEAGLLVEHRAGRRILNVLGPHRHRLAPDAAVWSLVRPGGGDGWDLLAARASRRVLITGGGRTGTTLAATLVAAGVGSVAVSDDRPVAAADVGLGGATLRDVGRSRREVAAEAAARLLGVPVPDGASAAPPPVGGDRSGSPRKEYRSGSPRKEYQSGSPRKEYRSGSPRKERRPDLVVLIEFAAADPTTGGHLLSEGIPHLSIVIRDDDVLIGPLVDAAGGPCLRCLDLHRQDRDPQWPSVLAQLLRPSPGAGEHEEAALSVLIAGLAALQVLGHLDGATPAAAGATLEVELPDGLVARRTWPAHPGCGCQWRSLSQLPPGSGEPW